MLIFITDFNQLLDLIYKFGALPLLMLAVWVLWKKVNKLEEKDEVKSKEHINDIKAHGQIYAGLLETTNFASTDTKRLISEGFKRLIEELKRMQNE